MDIVLRIAFLVLIFWLGKRFWQQRAERKFKKLMGQAIADCDKALKLNPNDAIAYNNRGYAKDKLGDYKGAIKDYDKAIELNPKLAEAYYNRSYSKNNLGDF